MKIKISLQRRFIRLYELLYKRFGPQHWWPGESPFEIIAGAILTQNTDWRNVEKALNNLKKKSLLTPHKLKTINTKSLAELIRPSGYFNIKAKRLKEFIKFLFEDYRGSLGNMKDEPLSTLRDKLLTVHGIGKETADSMLLYAFNKPVFVVDAYTKRILGRLRIISERASYDDIQKLFMEHLPRDARLFNEFHALFVRLGKQLCTKNNPHCNMCPLNKICRRNLIGKVGRILVILLCSFLISGCASFKYSGGRYRIYAKREMGKAMGQIHNPAKEQEGQLFAGAAKVDITPPVGTPLGGYSARKGRPSQGAHDRLYSRALALKDGEDLLVIVSAELIAIDDELYEAVFERVKKREGFASFGREDLMLIATHTHSGPGGIGRRFLEKLSTGSYNPDVFDYITDRIAESIIKASNNLKPARLASNSGYINGLNKNRMIKGGAVDTQLKALRIDDTTGNPIAFFVNFSAHPTVLGRTNMYFSGDYPGSLSRFIEERYPGSVSLFSCAAVADIAPDIPSEHKNLKGFEKSDQIGELLYKEVIKIVDDLKTSPDIDLSSIRVNVPLPPAKLKIFKPHLPSLLSEPFLDRFASFGVMRLGNILLIGVPCDLNVELGDEIKLKIESIGLDGYIVGFANDYIGYVIPEKYYKLDAYEAKMSFNGPKMDLYLKEVVYDLVDSITVKQFYKMDGLSILHLSGSPYEMGFKHGIIMQDEIKGCINDVLGYFRGYIKVPLLNRFIPDIILDTAWNKMKYFIPPEYEQEMKGLSDGSGVPLSEFHRLIALSEMTSSCSSFAGWGKATKDGRFYQTRNLDWNIRAGAQRYPVVLVYHPQNKHRFINIGYAGFVGVLSGINDEGIAVAEIGAKTKDANFRGMPFVFLLRNVLEESDDLNEAVDVIKSAKKTAGYNYIIGDSISGEAVALEVTKELCAVFKDNDPKEASSKYGLPIDDAIFRSDTAFDSDVRELQYASKGDPKMPGLEPPVGSSAYDIRYKRQAELIKEYYGAIDEGIAIKIAQEVAQGSNIQSIVYAWPNVYIANAKDTTPAAKREYQYISLEKLFANSD